MENSVVKTALACVVITSLAMAGPQKKKKPAAKPKEEIPSTMYAFRTQLLEMQPFLSSEELFTKQKNEKQILRHLESFAKFSKELKSHDRLKTAGFEPTAKQLEEYFQRTYEIYKGGNKSFAWWLFRSSIHACNQCHTQVAHKQAPSLEFPEGEITGTAFDQAEFWYAIRDYKRALMFYNSVVSRYGSGKVTSQQLRLSLNRILSITLRIDRSPAKAIDILTPAKDHPQIPRSIKVKIDEWIKDLWLLVKADPVNVVSVPPHALEQYSERALEDKRYPKSVFASGLLLEFVNTRQSEVTPAILFLLGSMLESTENDVFFTTSENYYKSCIEKFPASPKAKDCYSALKEKWTSGFTGSSGTDIPESYLQELRRLEAKIKK